MQSLKPKQEEELLKQIEDLRQELSEANETIEAIRTGQIDALVVHHEDGHELYTLKSADLTYRLFIEKMTEGAVTLDRHGIILYSNTRFAAMAGLPLSGVIGLPFSNFIASECLNEYQTLLEKCIGEDCRGEVVLDNTTKTPVLLSMARLSLDEGVYLSIILTDLTVQKENQEQLRVKNEELKRANRALELSNADLLQFASVASHDLQEPLRKIQIFGNILTSKRGDGFSVENRSYLEKIMASSERMKQLIIDILNYSRLSANQFLVERINLNELVNGLLSDYEVMIQERNAKIVVDELPEIEGNRGQLRQVFQNIISNALKFSKRSEVPTVHISSKSLKKKSDYGDGQYIEVCRISVKDNGIGFDERYIDNIFSLFERLNTKDRYEGSGIGLAIAKKIIEKHAGTITATSAEGKGSEFIIELPVLQSQTTTPEDE